MLIVIGGLPATGKTTLARLLASRTGAVHLRVDTIEQAVVRSDWPGIPWGRWAMSWGTPSPRSSCGRGSR